jgi:ABC-type branched-subunit amino acid transport system ATPase component
MTSQPPDGHPVPATAALVVQDVVAGYGGGDVLRGVSLQVSQGGITCVVGPNGAGKSTLLGTISGLLRPRLGKVSLHGEVLTGKTPRRILEMGVVQVPQNHSLFREMTVRENIVLGGYILRERGLPERRLDTVLGMFPQVTEWLGKKAGSLSGGQQRLVEFARCLMLDPKLVILDEPSMGLSPKVLKSVFDAVRMMNAQGKTVLLVEQNARAGLRLSTHGVVLENGQVRLAGTGREVLEHPEIGALYLGGAVTAGSGTAGSSTAGSGTAGSGTAGREGVNGSIPGNPL